VSRVVCQPHGGAVGELDRILDIGIRPADVREIVASVGVNVDPRFERWIERAGPLCWTAYVDGEPAAIYGLSPITERVASAWAFGTRAMRRAVPAMTRHIHLVMWPSAVRYGFHRAEARSIEGHDLSHRWLPKIGMRHEGVCRAFGARRETFHLYAWTS
jgi:RimJ/RimL family protein N-acetyltransferase